MKEKMKKYTPVILVLIVAFAGAAFGLTQEAFYSAVYNSTDSSVNMTTTSGAFTGAVTVGAGVQVDETTALTNTVNYPVLITHDTSGTPAANIGVGINFQQETVAGDEVVMSLDAVMSNVASGTEDAGFSLKLMAAGAAKSEVLSIGSTGIISLDGGATLDNTTAATELVIAETNIQLSGIIDLEGGQVTVNDDSGDYDFTIEGNGVDPLFMTDAGNDRVGIGTATPDVLFETLYSGSSTTTVDNQVKISSLTSGAPANGIGTGISFETETSAANYEVGMNIDSVTTDVTGGNEDFTFSVKLMAAGAAVAEKFSVLSTGLVTLVNAATIDNTVNGTITLDEPSAATNTAVNTVTIGHSTSGVPATGIGTGLAFSGEDDGGATQVGMSLQAVTTDATAASEDYDLIVNLMDGGSAAAERFRVTSDGVVTLINAETIDNTLNGTITYTATTHAFTGNVTASGSVDVTGAGGIILQNDETITNGTNGQIDINGDTYLAGAVKYEPCTVADGDLTPDVAGCYIVTTSSNTGATAISDLDNPVVGSIVVIIGGSDTNSSTIADSGNFNLSAGFVAAVDDTLTLYIQADNDYVELGRTNN